MTEILLCNQPLRADYLLNSCGIELDLIRGSSCDKLDTISAFTPYVLTKEKTTFDQQILTPLSPIPVAKQLTNLSLSFGGDNT